jgi:hypothetical protein
MAKIGGLNKLLTILANPDDDPTVLTLALLALQNLLLDGIYAHLYFYFYFTSIRRRRRQRSLALAKEKTKRRRALTRPTTNDTQPSCVTL